MEKKTAYYKVELVFEKDGYGLRVKEMPEELFRKAGGVEFNKVYSVPNQSWIYVRHEGDEGKKKLLLFKAKNKLVHHENAGLSARTANLNALYDDFQEASLCGVKNRIDFLKRCIFQDRDLVNQLEENIREANGRIEEKEKEVKRLEEKLKA